MSIRNIIFPLGLWLMGIPFTPHSFAQTEDEFRKGIIREHAAEPEWLKGREEENRLRSERYNEPPLDKDALLEKAMQRYGKTLDDFYNHRWEPTPEEVEEYRLKHERAIKEQMNRGDEVQQSAEKQLDGSAEAP